MFKSILYSGIFSAVLLAPSAAFAQFAVDSNAPIDGSADRAEYSGDVTTLYGQVDIRQGQTRILSDTMKVYSQNGSSQSGAFENVRRIEAFGNFYYITPEQEVRGENGVYEAEADTFTVTGDVILLQGEDNVVTGDKLVYTLSSREARVVGTCTGRKCGDKGRVKILIKNSNGGLAPQPAS